MDRSAKSQTERDWERREEAAFDDPSGSVRRSKCGTFAASIARLAWRSTSGASGPEHGHSPVSVSWSQRQYIDQLEIINFRLVSFREGNE